MEKTKYRCEHDEGDACPYECSGYLVGDLQQLLVCSECEEIFYPYPIKE